uniref:Serpin B6 n=1 Tax=Cyprinus carpio TaxID=7962 RepID=A0A8C1SQ82_CYPCA
MKMIILLFKLLLFLTQLVKMEPLSSANTQFSLNLFKKISGGNASGNVFYSPISISSALAMVSLGAKGNTATQMFKVLSFTNPPKPDAATPASHQQAQKPQIACGVKGQHGPSMTQQTQKFEKCPPRPAPGQKTEDQIHSSFNKLMSELKKPGAPYVLSLANRLYGEQSYQFVEKFLNDGKRYYEAGLEEVDFKMNSDAARVDINSWVEKNTQGKIKDLLPQGSIDEMTRLVLVNAIYFKGNWEAKFRKKATRDGQFKLNKTQTKPVKMMYQKPEFPLASIPEMNSQVLELPYVGKNVSMLIILPNEIQDETTGLQKLEKALTYEKLMEWTRPEIMHQQEVEVSLPRFKMEETYDMKSLLISMGMEDVFNEQKVNLSGMSPSNDLVLTKVIHKAFVEVNEEGTEAAAATGIVARPCCLSIPQVFNADHPFLFFIRHNPTKSILFYGRFCSP